jgi:predicted Zn-dependent peptidase
LEGPVIANRGLIRPTVFLWVGAGLGWAAACTPLRPTTGYELDYPMPSHLPVSTERYRLDNGLEVLAAVDHTVPFVAVNLWYHAGSKDDPAGKAGLAHLFEHMMFNGSRHVPATDHFALLTQIGAKNINAMTSQDETWYFETVPSGGLERALWLESDRMGFLLDALDQGKLDNERRVVENELRERLDETPYGRVGTTTWAALFPSPHPYHYPVIGESAQLDAITLDDVRTFFRAWYAPSQCTLALVGDFDPARAQALVTKYFGSIAAGLPATRETTAPAPLQGEKRLTIEADVPRARVIVAWPVVPAFAPGSAELEVGRGPLAGWLSKELVDGLKVASSVEVSLDEHDLASVFAVTAELEPGRSSDAALAEIEGRLHEIRGPQARYDRVQFAIERAQLLAAPLRAADRLVDRAQLLQRYNDKTGTPDYADDELSARRSVLVEDVRKAYYDLLRWDRRVVVLVVPRRGAPLAGRLVGAP